MRLEKGPSSKLENTSRHSAGTQRYEVKLVWLI